MDKLDKVIQEQIKNEYDEITPNPDNFQMTLQKAKEVYESKNESMKKTYEWKRWVIAATVFVAIIFLANINSVKAFVMGIYEKYFNQVQVDFDNNTKDYIKELNLEYNIEGEKIIISQYVITDKGIDFKIIRNQDSKVHICACEIKEDDNQTYNEMIVSLDDYFIASNIVDNIKLTGKKDVKINIVYYLDGDEEHLYEKEMETTLDCSKIYHIKTITNKDKVIAQNDNFAIKNISFYTWYMKVEYEIKDAATEAILKIRQKNEECVCASSSSTEKGQISYYQLPRTMEDIEVAIEYFNNDNIKSDNDMTSVKIDLKKLLEEDGNE